MSIRESSLKPYQILTSTEEMKAFRVTLFHLIRRYDYVANFYHINYILSFDRIELHALELGSLSNIKRRESIEVQTLFL